MKFKVGDKVKILSNIDSDMNAYIAYMIGKESEIIGVNTEGMTYRFQCLTDSNYYWWFTEDELELVEDNSTETKRFKHFKGGVYKLLHHGFDSKDLSKVVIYQSEETGDIFVRPHDEFFGTVTKQRFELIEGE